jgi:hypothetical protein
VTGLVQKDFGSTVEGHGFQPCRKGRLESGL